MANYLDVDELSDYLHMSKSTLYKKTMDFKIPFIKTGKKLLFKQEAIDLWLEDHSYHTKPELTNNISEFLKPQRKESK